MRRRARHWSLAMAATIGATSLAAIVAALAVGRPSPDHVRIPVGELRARAAEAWLVARGGARGELTAAFVRAQARQIAQRVEPLVPELAKRSTEVPLPEAHEAAKLAPEVHALVQSLDRAAGDAAAAARLEQELRARSARLSALERGVARNGH